MKKLFIGGLIAIGVIGAFAVKTLSNFASRFGIFGVFLGSLYLIYHTFSKTVKFFESLGCSCPIAPAFFLTAVFISAAIGLSYFFMAFISKRSDYNTRGSSHHGW